MLYLNVDDENRNFGSFTQNRRGPKVSTYDEPKLETCSVHAFVSNYTDDLALVGVQTIAEGADEPEGVTFYVNAKGAAELATYFAFLASKLG